jgi:hypothetical protein
MIKKLLLLATVIFFFSCEETNKTEKIALAFSKTPKVDSVKSTSAYLGWETTKTTQARILYGKETDNYTDTLNVSVGPKIAKKIVSDLDPETEYFAVVQLVSGEEKFTSDEFSFKTLKKSIESISIDKIHDMKLSKDDSVEYKIEGTLLIREKVLHSKEYRSYIVSESGKGLYLYDSYESDMSTYKRGDKISFVGLPYKKYVNKRLKITSDLKVISKGNSIPAGKELSLADANRLDRNMNELISVTALVKEIDKTDKYSIKIILTDATNTSEFIVFLPKELETSIDYSQIFKGDKIKVTGIKHAQYNYSLKGNYSMMYILSQNDLEDLTTTVPLLIKSGPSISTKVDSATISWESTKLAVAEIHYGLDTSYGSTIEMTTAATSGSVDIPGLTADTEYHAKVVLEFMGEKVESEDLTFKTKPLVQNPTLIFSEYVEGGSYNKAVEIYNATSSDVNLKDYVFAKFSNGDAANRAYFSFDKDYILAAGKTYVIAHSSSSNELKAKADTLENTFVNFNGDDPLAIVTKASYGDAVDISNLVVIDFIGLIGNEVGWGKDKTLRRKAGIVSGVTTMPSTFDHKIDWDKFPKDTFDGLGSR